MGKKLTEGVDDLSTRFPSIAGEWHPSRNGDLAPNQIFGGSTYKAWWQCSLGHEWQARVGDRTTYSTGCPYCANKKTLTGFNDLLTRFPDVASEWNFDKNSGMTPASIHFGSKTRIDWRCNLGHEWVATVQMRTSQGQSCPVCSNNVVQIGVNDLATTHPELAREWHPILNLPLTPQGLVAGTAKKIWWRCSLGHEWCVSGNQRVTFNSGCPVCGNKRALKGYNDLATTKPQVARRWHETLNGDVTPDRVTAGSNKKFWWSCDFGHAWQASVASLTNPTKSQGCGVCAGKVIVPGVNDLASLRPDLVAEWDTQKNETMDPTRVAASSHKKVWWKCDAGHEWQASITNRNTRESQCPGCATGGYDSSQAGTLYFIAHESLFARKIGITNSGAKNDRISNWKKNGWKVLYSASSENGRAILETETHLLAWIRNVHGLPPFLGREDMGKMAGWSETFSSEGPSDESVISEIRSRLSEYSIFYESDSLGE